MGEPLDLPLDILFNIVPRSPITTGMTTTLIFETFCYLMALVNFFILFDGYILFPRNCKGNNVTLSLLLVDTNYVW